VTKADLLITRPELEELHARLRVFAARLVQQQFLPTKDERVQAARDIERIVARDV
jgi:hypothetical protein